MLEAGKYYISSEGSVYGPMVYSEKYSLFMCERSGIWFYSSGEEDLQSHEPVNLVKESKRPALHKHTFKVRVDNESCIGVEFEDGKSELGIFIEVIKDGVPKISYVVLDGYSSSVLLSVLKEATRKN